jgi:hypothetical protein
MRGITRLAVASALAGVTAFGSAGMAAPASAGSVRLGPLLRVQSPAGTPNLCPIESEPEIARTSAGTWVAYNDDAGCAFGAGTAAHDHLRLTGVQLLPAHGGARRVVELPKAWANTGSYLGDPDLAPDPAGGGGVELATIVEEHDTVRASVYGLHVTVVRIPANGAASLLPSPSTGSNDDKEFLATDTGAHSRFRGRTYLVWQDLDTFKVMFRAYDGHRWLRPVVLGDAPSAPDVAVSPNGDVAVVLDAPGDIIAARVSRDGGLSFSAATSILAGPPPGRYDQACNSLSTVSQRQRASWSPRAAWDTKGGLHVVAAVSTVSSQSGVLVGGQGRILHVVSRDGGRSYSRPQPVGSTETDQVQWAPAIAALPSGGVAVSYLQTAQTTGYEALAAVQPMGAYRFRTPVVLSESVGQMPEVTELAGNGTCYGLGDYTGLATTADGVVATWPTTVGVETSYLDSDIAVREVHVSR